MMGVWFMGTALGNVISGLIAGEFDPNNLQAMPGQYWKIFLTIGGNHLAFRCFRCGQSADRVQGDSPQIRASA